MKRRVLFASIAGAALLPGSVRAQQKTMPVIGVVMAPLNRKPFEQGLRDLGHVDGRTIHLEYRWFDQANQLDDITNELVHLKVDVLVAQGSQATRAAQHATRTIPIVMAASSDPVGIGLIASLARPGGNITGQSMQNTDVSAKRLELLKELVPGLARVGALLPDDPPAVLALKEAQTAAGPLGLELQVAEVRGTGDFDAAFRLFTATSSQALFILPAPLMSNNIRQVAEWTLKVSLPSIFARRIYPDAGGLMSYGVNFDALMRRAPIYLDKVLKGAKPGDLPVEQPAIFEFVINMKTAKALGLTIPLSILARADEVIE